MTATRRSPRPAVRDPQRTRDRIIAAALAEFSSRGLAGARVDRIARRARVNKRMLYHYFGNKRDLFRAILRIKVGDTAWLDRAPEDPGALLEYWFTLACQDADWVRLVQWEALRSGGAAVIGEAERREAFERGVAQVRQRQARGLLARDLDPREVLLAMIALTTFPLAFPQITRLVTGFQPGDAGFRARHVAFLSRMAGVFRAQPAAAPRPGRPGRQRIPVPA